MRIFAIDPGNISSAYCVMDEEYLLYEFEKLPNRKCMMKLMDWLNDGAVDQVVIERIQSYGMSVGHEVFETCEWIGRFSEASEFYCPADYIYRKEEKLYLCGEMRAKDSNIRSALIERFAKFDKKNGKGTKDNPDVFYGVHADCWAAIAVAVTWFDKRKEKSVKENGYVKSGNERVAGGEGNGT